MLPCLLSDSGHPACSALSAVPPNPSKARPSADVSVQPRRASSNRLCLGGELIDFTAAALPLLLSRYPAANASAQAPAPPAQEEIANETRSCFLLHSLADLPQECCLPPAEAHKLAQEAKGQMGQKMSESMQSFTDFTATSARPGLWRKPRQRQQQERQVCEPCRRFQLMTARPGPRQAECTGVPGACFLPLAEDDAAKR